MLLQGLLQVVMKSNWPACEDYYSKALKLLEQGKAMWADVAPEDRGAIFSDTFIRGVKRLHLAAYAQVCGLHVPIDDTLLTLITIRHVAFCMKWAMKRVIQSISS
jgi:hypothetical protein